LSTDRLDFSIHQIERFHNISIAKSFEDLIKVVLHYLLEFECRYLVFDCC